VAIGIIGPGVATTNSRNPKGVFLRGGPKFLLGSSSDVVTEDTKDRYAHPLKGRYVKVEIILNAFSTSNNRAYPSQSYFPTYPSTGAVYFKKEYQSLTIDLQYGRQYIFGNAMTLGWYAGAGYSFENETSYLPAGYYDNDWDLSRYSHTYFGNSFPMVFTWGLTVGYIMPAPKWMVSKKAVVASKPKPPTRHSMNDK
jgi:hypothetical protein